MKRPYDTISQKAEARGDRQQRMRQVVDLLWDTLEATGVSWVGFYLPDGEDQLVLGPMRNKPACSPIGLHGACGQCYLQGKAIIVDDVANLGENYIACDPRDRSEVVVPLFDEQGKCWAVLDVDSHETGAFIEEDAEGLISVLRAAALTC